MTLGTVYKIYELDINIKEDLKQLSQYITKKANMIDAYRLTQLSSTQPCSSNPNQSSWAHLQTSEIDDSFNGYKNMDLPIFKTLTQNLEATLCYSNKDVGRRLNTSVKNIQSFILEPNRMSMIKEEMNKPLLLRTKKRSSQKKKWYANIVNRSTSVVARKQSRLTPNLKGLEMPNTASMNKLKSPFESRYSKY